MKILYRYWLQGKEELVGGEYKDAESGEGKAFRYRGKAGTLAQFFFRMEEKETLTAPRLISTLKTKSRKSFSSAYWAISTGSDEDAPALQDLDLRNEFENELARAFGKMLQDGVGTFLRTALQATTANKEYTAEAILASAGEDLGVAKKLKWVGVRPALAWGLEWKTCDPAAVFWWSALLGATLNGLLCCTECGKAFFRTTARDKFCKKCRSEEERQKIYRERRKEDPAKALYTKAYNRMYARIKTREQGGEEDLKRWLKKAKDLLARQLPLDEFKTAMESLEEETMRGLQ